MGGFAVIPLPDTLRRIHRPTVRVAAIVMALAMVQALRRALIKLRADTAIELHHRHNQSWAAIAGRFGVTERYIYVAAERRRAELADLGQPQTLCVCSHTYTDRGLPKAA
jgi:hypothetical protein